MKKIALCTAVLALMAGAAAPAAAAESQVVLYSANDDTVNKLVSEGFKKETGITVNVISTGSGVLFRRIASEAGNPQGDVVWGVSSALLKQNGKYFQAYAVKGREAVPAEYRDANDMWIGTNLQVVTINQNTKAIDAASAPKTWQDLLDPKWKGKIAWTNDPTPQGPPGFIHNILLTMGDAKGMDYLKRFAAQEPVFIPASQRVVLDKMISGEYPLAVMTFNHHAAISAAQGAPVAWIRMEPLSESINLIGILNDAPHPNAARLLEEFILSDEGQTLLADNDYLPANPAVPAKVADLKPDAGHFKVNVVTPDMSRDDLPKWTAIYRELFR
jgi:iron(III) transport system substrate-binding protein